MASLDGIEPSPTFHTYAGERTEGLRAKQEDLPAPIFMQLDLQASNEAATLRYPSIKEPLAALPVHEGCGWEATTGTFLVVTLHQG